MNPDPLRPCIFFDRDGVVNQSPGPGYVNHFDDFHLLPGFIDCVRMAAAQGLPAIIVTNQRGITRGITPPEQLETMHRHIQEELAAEDLSLLDILVCTANDNTHPDRKPNPGMLHTAATRHHLDLARSWMIGDRETDVQTGQNAGVSTTVLVDPGEVPTAATWRVPNMSACADLLREQL